MSVPVKVGLTWTVFEALVFGKRMMEGKPGILCRSLLTMIILLLSKRLLLRIQVLY